MLYFLNSPVLTNWGEYKFYKITTEEAYTVWNNISTSEKISTCGHKETVEFLKKIGFEIEENRIFAKMKSGDKAIVLKMNTRISAGKLLTAEEIEKMDFEFGMLECVKSL